MYGRSRLACVVIQTVAYVFAQVVAEVVSLVGAQDVAQFVSLVGSPCFLVVTTLIIDVIIHKYEGQSGGSRCHLAIRRFLVFCSLKYSREVQLTMGSCPRRYREGLTVKLMHNVFIIYRLSCFWTIRLNLVYPHV